VLKSETAVSSIETDFPKCPLNHAAATFIAVKNAMKSNRLATLALLTTLMVTFVPSVILYANAQKEQDRALKFIEIAEKAKAKVDELIEFIESKGIAIPDELEANYTEADDKLEEAKSKSASDPQDAIELAKEAMTLFRKLYGKLHTLLNDGGVDTESAEKAKGLLVAIDRENETIARIRDANNTYFKLYPEREAEAATIIGWIRGNLTLAQNNLTEARDAIVVYHNATMAAANLTEAKKCVHDAFTALKSLAEWTTSWRVESFLMGIKNSVEKTKEMLERAQKQGVNITAVLEALGYEDTNGNHELMDEFLNEVQGLIDEAREMRMEKLKEAIDVIKDIRDKLTGIHKELPEHRKGGPKEK